MKTVKKELMQKNKKKVEKWKKDEAHPKRIA